MRSCKVLGWKGQNEIGKIGVGKFEPKLKSSWRSWKVRDKVGKSVGSFQLRSVLSNFVEFFSTSLGSLQLR